MINIFKDLKFTYIKMSKSVNKNNTETNYGKTLLVQESKNKFNKDVFDNLDGLKNVHTSDKSRYKCHFLEFDSEKNSKKAMETLSENENCRVKFALYKVFFKFSNFGSDSLLSRSLLVQFNNNVNMKLLSDLSDIESKAKVNDKKYCVVFTTTQSLVDCMEKLSSNKNLTLQRMLDYNYLKKTHCNLIKEKTGNRVMYYKLYKKGIKENSFFLGCGELTLDTKSSNDVLLSDDGLKNYDLGLCGVTGTHYRYVRSNKNSNVSNNNV